MLKSFHSSFFGISFLSLGIRVLGTALMFFSHVIFARIMSPSDYGLFSYIYNFVLILAILSQCGFQFSCVRLIAEFQSNKAQIGAFIGAGLKTTLTTSLFICACCLVINSFIKVENFLLKSTLTFPVFLCVLIALNTFTQQCLRSLKLIFSSQIYEQIALPLLLILWGIYMFFQKKILTYEDAILLIGSIYFLIGAYTFYLLNLQVKVQWESDPKDFKQWFKTSIPLGIWGILSVLLNRIDLIILGAFTNDVTIAEYSIASRIAGLLVFIPAALNSIGEPTISSLFFQKKFSEINLLIKKIFRVSLTLNLVLLLFLYFWGDYLLGAFGKNYIQNKNLLIILGTSQLLNFTNSILIILFTVQGKQKNLLKIMLASIFLLVVFLLASVPRWKSLGASYSVLATTIIMDFWLICLMKKEIKLSS
jgi:O-antigen/teichoic acid export membrane protein